MRRTIPGSHITVYGGPYEVATREINRFFLNEWDAWADRRYDSGQMTFFTLQRRRMRIRDDLRMIRSGGRWWTRLWWWDNLPECKGGAPDSPVITRLSRTYRIIDTPAFFLTNSGNFRWKALRATIDLKSKDIFHLGDKKDWSGVGWKVSFRPRLKFTTSGRSLETMIRSVGINIVLSRWSGNRRLFDVWISNRYNPEDAEFVVLFQINFVRW